MVVLSVEMHFFIWARLPSVQVSPHHRRPSSRTIRTFGTPDSKVSDCYIELLAKNGTRQRLNAFVKGNWVGSIPTSNSKYEAPGWDQIYDMLVSLAARIRSQRYEPDVIVGVSRGGWPPARIMSDLLENSNVANMKVEFYKDIGVRSERPRITQPVTAEVKGKEVLVVDDVSDTGHSLKVVANHLRKKGTKDLKVCTIYVKPKSVFRPDFFAKSTRKWIIFPWERLEAIKLIANSVDPSHSHPSSIARELKDSGISLRLVKELESILAIDGRD